MKDVLLTLMPLALPITVFTLMDWMGSNRIFGKPMREKEIDAWFKKHPLEQYELMDGDSDMLWHPGWGYLSTQTMGVLTKWYIRGETGRVGRIPRWSKWHRRINQFQGLLVKVYKNNNQ